ncbi:MAG: cupin domain-containing protein, partial [Acidimicrobiales bacterium]
EQAGLGAAAPSAYVGEAHVQVLPSPFDGFDVGYVQLEPGSRSRPSASASGRLVQVVSGEGVVAGPDERVVVVAGDTAVVPAGEWHWHGALPHVAVVLLIVDRPEDVSWNVAERDWMIGYAAPPAGGERAT